MMAPKSERANYMQRLPGGMCFAHGRYAGMECPKWPACATDRQNPDFVREGMREVNKIGVDGEGVEVGRGGQQTKSSTGSESPSACSEVVERLHAEWLDQWHEDNGYALCGFYDLHDLAVIKQKLSKLLTIYQKSWRERRVQELEEALREIAGAGDRQNDLLRRLKYVFRRFPRNLEEQPPQSDEEWWEYLAFHEHTDIWELAQLAERALANSEQIRKGAKHD